jgi:hypothetical protein
MPTKWRSGSPPVAAGFYGPASSGELHRHPDPLETKYRIGSHDILAMQLFRVKIIRCRANRDISIGNHADQLIAITNR